MLFCHILELGSVQEGCHEERAEGGQEEDRRRGQSQARHIAHTFSILKFLVTVPTFGYLAVKPAKLC